MLAEDVARLLRVATLQGRSGQRARFEDGETVIHVSGHERDPDHPEAPALPILTERVAGLVFEMDPFISGFNDYIDLNFALEFHTAAPRWRPWEPAGERASDAPADTLPAPVFHAKKLVTQLSLRDGDTRLLGSWTPTGDPATEGKGLRHLVFLTAHLQE